MLSAHSFLLRLALRDLGPDSGPRTVDNSWEYATLKYFFTQKADPTKNRYAASGQLEIQEGCARHSE
jgi:hypothetical protein